MIFALRLADEASPVFVGGDEPVAVLVSPAAGGDRQRADLDVEVASLAQQVNLAVGDPAEVPACRRRGAKSSPRVPLTRRSRAID
jgi:hypothetical protein